MNHFAALFKALMQLFFIVFGVALVIGTLIVHWLTN